MSKLTSCRIAAVALAASLLLGATSAQQLAAQTKVFVTNPSTTL